MLKVGLAGIGFMGRTHLDNYIRLEKEGYPVKLVALCDVDPEKLKGKFVQGNIGEAADSYDLSKYKLYTNLEDMLDNEDLDVVDLPLPTFLHAEATIKALNKGRHVLCEKPMSLNPELCQAMIDASKKNGKKLMIGQCLRFWPAYEYLKECVDTGKYGKVISGYFFRGGTTPTWSWNNWLLNKEKSGGCILDQHVHDIDTINWLFGKPQRLSTIAKNVIKGSGYDVVSTNYMYDDGKVINAQDDWTLNGDYGFDMKFRVNFERGNLVFEHGVLLVNPNEEAAFKPELLADDGYYRELKYYYNSIENNLDLEKAPLESTKATIEIAVKEIESADKNGEIVYL